MTAQEDQAMLRGDHVGAFKSLNPGGLPRNGLDFPVHSQYPSPRPTSVWLIVAHKGEGTYAKPVRSFPSKAEAEKVLAVVQELGGIDPGGVVDIIEVPAW